MVAHVYALRAAAEGWRSQGRPLRAAQGLSILLLWMCVPGKGMPYVLVGEGS